MNREVLRRIRGGEAPGRIGAEAHRILDYVHHDGWWFVQTPRFGWHEATQREAGLLAARVGRAAKKGA